jgi:hypothetical protein
VLTTNNREPEDNSVRRHILDNLYWLGVLCLLAMAMTCVVTFGHQQDLGAGSIPGKANGPTVEQALIASGEPIEQALDNPRPVPAGNFRLVPYSPAQPDSPAQPAPKLNRPAGQ